MQIREVYQTRNHCLAWRMSPGSTSPSSMGGTRPLDAPANSCPTCGTPMRYWLTLGEDLIGSEVCGTAAVSLFYCNERDGECLWAARDPNKSGGLVVCSHPGTGRVAETESWPWAKERYVIAPHDLVAASEAEPLTRTGGMPRFVQSWGEVLVQSISSDFGFLFQVEDWPEGTTPKSAILGGGGAVYVFARLEARTKLPTLEEFRVFCQM